MHLPEVEDIYRHLHQMPELSWQEEKTMRYILHFVQDMAHHSVWPLRVCQSNGGVWVDLCIYDKQPFALLRAEIDALPIQENTGLAYASRLWGVMHACGHDMHTAMMLGLIKLCASGQIPVRHNLRFVFQRAEERGPSGAKALVNSGVLDHVCEAYALHICSELPLGNFYLRAGVVLALSATVKISAQTAPSHTASLQNDAFSVADQIMQTVMNLTGKEPAVLLKRHLCHCTTTNLKLVYRLRSHLLKAEQEDFCARLEQEVLAIPQGRQARVAVSIKTRSVPVINDQYLVAKVSRLLATKQVAVEQAIPHFASDDFGYFCERVPAVYMVLGASDQENPASHHTPEFKPSLQVMRYGLEYWQWLVGESLGCEI